MSAVPIHRKPPVGQHRVTRSSSGASDRWRNPASDQATIIADAADAEARDVYGIRKVALVVSTKQAITQAYTDIINELAIIDELSMNKKRSSGTEFLANNTNNKRSSSAELTIKQQFSSHNVRNDVATNESQSAVVAQPSSIAEAEDIKTVVTKQSFVSPTMTPSVNPSIFAPQQDNAGAKLHIPATGSAQTQLSSPISTSAPVVDYCEEAASEKTENKEIESEDADIVNRERFNACLDRRMKIAREIFYQSNPQACEASRVPAKRMLDLSANDAPNDLRRPFATLKTHYDSRRQLSTNWIPDPRDFCRTYQRLLPVGWASRIVECKIKTEDGGLASEPHAVLYVWRDGAPGLWIADQRATSICGIDIEANYLNWEVTPLHFSTLIKPQRTLAWPGLRKVFKK